MAEKPGVVPMFETIICRSCGETVLRINLLHLATFSLVSSMRVPEGAFMLMVNMPASVRGKNARPM